MFDDLEVPWNVPMRELFARYGARSHSVYGWKVIEFPLPKLALPGMLFPLYTNALRVAAPSPTDYFATSVSVGDDPRVNIQAASSFFSKWLGEAPVVHEDGFSFRSEWIAGPASVSLQAADPHPIYSSQVSTADDREPRLRRACSVAIHPGFRAPLSGLERAQATTARRLLRIAEDADVRSLEALRRRRPWVTEAPFAREPDESCVRLLGGLHLSADGGTLIVCRQQLLFIPRERIAGLRVTKLSRARGPAGSWLDLVCADEASDDGFSFVTVLKGHRTNQLDGRARSLGATLDVPVDIRPAQQNA